jgi:hypothetical protein
MIIEINKSAAYNLTSVIHKLPVSKKIRLTAYNCASLKPL